MNANLISLLLVIMFLLFGDLIYASPTCTYQAYTWNTQSKTAQEFRTIQKPYASVTVNERDPVTGCTVCEEDQREILLSPLEPFKVCKLLADSIKDTLAGLMAQGEPVISVVGYRVGMTRGDTDRYGNRTRFSNHSFGVALDINSEQNGLYDHCVTFSASCRLRRGGHWQPGKRGVLTAESAIVNAMKSLGYKWGGEIAGQQKDFMHFSPSGY